MLDSIAEEIERAASLRIEIDCLAPKRFESIEAGTVHSVDSKPETLPNSGDPLNNSRHGSIRRPLILAIILFTLGVYSYPALETRAKTGSAESPAILAPDTGFYLFISTLTRLNSGAVVNPYYGIEVTPDATAHLKFQLAFRLFGYLDKVLGGHLWLALFVWNLIWWGLLCWIAVWLFEQFLPDNSLLLVALGIALLMWSNFGLLKPLVSAWIHLPSLHGFEEIGLAYARPFFPQVPVPLLLAYLGLQMSVLRARRLGIWAGMGLIQLIAFAIFPYTTLMMAGITLVTAVWLLVARFQSAPWRSQVAYGVSCAALDLLYLKVGGHGALTGQAPAQGLFRIELAALPNLIGGMWIILGCVTLATALVRSLPPEVKWPLVGMGLANLSLMLGDVFFSETALMISHHAGYFVHPTVAVLLTFIVSAVCVRSVATTRYLRLALGGVVLLLAVNVMLLAGADYRLFLPLNQQKAETTRLLKSIPVRADDLLIVHAKISDDACEWAPLVESAKVLYCRPASGLLTVNQIHTVQRLRQALYLYFTGMDSRQLERITEDPKAVEEQMRLAYFGGIVPFRKEERAGGLSAIRTELIPLLNDAERQDPRLHFFFRQYRRILVIDNQQNPVFDRQRLASYLVIQKEMPVGSLVVLFCGAK